MEIVRITDLHIPQLDMYVGTNEVGLLRYFEPEQGVFIAESPNVIERALVAGYEPLSFLMEEKSYEKMPQKIIDLVVQWEKKPLVHQIPMYVTDENTMKALAGYPMTRGLLCAMRRRELPTLEGICKNAKRIAILENVMNPTNVGAIFRSAAALNMDAVLLTDGCSDPLYRRACRVSMGTVFQIPWTFLSKEEWPNTALGQLGKFGYKTAAMALTDDSVSIDDEQLLREDKLAILLGTEGTGLMQKTIDRCDYTVKIPMAHGVDSLNVAAASAVAFWQLAQHSTH